MHHCPSINAVPSVPALALLPLFPHAWPRKNFTEWSYTEATAGRKLRPPFIKRSLNLNHLGRTGIPYFDCTLAPFSSNLISFIQLSSTPQLPFFYHVLPLSVHMYLPFPISFPVRAFSGQWSHTSPQVGIRPSTLGLLVCWLSANMIINQSNHHQRQELQKKTWAGLGRSRKNHIKRRKNQKIKVWESKLR